jgi:glycerol-3-phosphate O-acyltransferase
MAWANMFSGHIKNVEDLKKFFINQRKQLLHEFYLPTVKEFFNLALAIVTDAIGREVTNLEECLELNPKELYQILAKVGIFSHACNYLIEAYYVSGVTLIELANDQPEGFKMETYLKKYKETFEAERKLQRIIKYSESYSVPLSRSSLEYYVHTKILESKNGFFVLNNAEKLNQIVDKMEEDLSSPSMINLLN